MLISSIMEFRRCFIHFNCSKAEEVMSKICKRRNKVTYSFQKSEGTVDYDLCQKSRRKHVCHIHMRLHVEDCIMSENEKYQVQQHTFGGET